MSFTTLAFTVAVLPTISSGTLADLLGRYLSVPLYAAVKLYLPSLFRFVTIVAIPSCTSACPIVCVLPSGPVAWMVTVPFGTLLPFTSRTSASIVTFPAVLFTTSSVVVVLIFVTFTSFSVVSLPLNTSFPSYLMLNV